MSGAEAIVSRVAAALGEENAFCGRLVGADLAGRESFWSTLVLALSGTLPAAPWPVLLDDLSVCTLAADPRIWPLKASRLVAGEGSAMAGIAGGMLAQTDAMVGASAPAAAARQLESLRRRLPADWTDADVEALLGRMLEAGEMVLGFGVAFREHDERVVAFRDCLRRREIVLDGPHWRLMEAFEAALGRLGGPNINVGAVIGAVALDAGVPSRHIDLLAAVLMIVNFVANAAEAADQREPVMRDLPRAEVDYIGPEPRRSPRAREQDA